MAKQKKQKKDKLPKQVMLNTTIDTNYNWIPLGVTLNKKGKPISIGWNLNTEYLDYDKKRYNTYPSTSLLISGSTDSGKSYMIKNIVNHIDKFSDKFQLIGVDTIGITYSVMLDKFTCMATNINSMISTITSVQKLMMFRYRLMEENKCNHISKVNNKQIIVPYYILHDKQYQFDEFITIKADLDKDDRDYSKLITIYPDGKRTYIMPIEEVYNMLNNKTFSNVIIDNNIVKLSDIKKTEGIYNAKSIVMIIDNLDEIMFSDDYKAIDILKQSLGSITRLGRASDVHLVLACQRASGRTINADLKNNIQMRCLLGGFDDDTSQLIFEKDISNLCKPEIKGRGFIGFDNKILETQFYSGILTTF